MSFNLPRFLLSFLMIAMLVGCSAETNSGTGSRIENSGPYSVSDIDDSTKRIEIKGISFQFPSKFKVSYEKDDPSWTVNYLENGVTIREMTSSDETDAASWAEMNADMLSSKKTSSCQRKLGSSNLTGIKIELTQTYIEFYDLPSSNANDRIIEISYSKRETKDSVRLLELLENGFKIK